MSSSPAGRRFTTQFNRDAVELSRQRDQSVVALARHLGIRLELLYRWRSEYRQQFPHHAGIARPRLPCESPSGRPPHAATGLTAKTHRAPSCCSIRIAAGSRRPKHSGSIWLTMRGSKA
ncbi:MAG: transposase [Candidatus Marinimicrobia bacterium]|nr:transposase [Candidatus Neomarinimicrobiota bacterium]